MGKEYSKFLILFIISFIFSCILFNEAKKFQRNKEEIKNE